MRKNKSARIPSLSPLDGVVSRLAHTACYPPRGLATCVDQLPSAGGGREDRDTYEIGAGELVLASPRCQTRRTSTK